MLPIFGVRSFQGVQNIVTIDPEKSRDYSFKNPGILLEPAIGALDAASSLLLRMGLYARLLQPVPSVCKLTQ